MYLASMGIGRLGIVDSDVVDTGNLQRQVIHSSETVGDPKVESAAGFVRRLNPLVEVVEYKEEFTSSTAMRIMGAGWDVVLDGSDNFPTKYLINDACSLTNTPWVYSAILGFVGQVAAFNVEEGWPDYRDLMEVPPDPGAVPSCAEGGVLGVLPGIMGTLQAMEVVKTIMYLKSRDYGHEGVKSIGEPGGGRGIVTVYDAVKGEWTTVKVVRKEGREEIRELIDYKGFCGFGGGTAGGNDGGRTMDEAEVGGGGDAEVNSLGPEEVMQKMLDGWSPYVLDVRIPTEASIVTLPFVDALVPHREVKKSDVPVHGDVLIYCKGGVRSTKAIRSLVDMGIDGSRLFEMEGGIMGWREYIDSSMPEY